MKQEAGLYEKLEGGKVSCGVCQRRCLIAEGKRGWCRTRVNENGTLYSLIYGEVSSISVNPIEKKPVYHFLPGSQWLSLGSVGCNFRCPGCQNWDISHWEGGDMHTEYIPPDELVLLAKKGDCAGISWTFNEPAIWVEYTLDGARLAKAEGLHTNYVTNGFISKEAFGAIAPYLDIYRVDIKAFSKETYMRTGHIKDYRGILDVAELAASRGIHVEAVTNVTPEFNDNETELRGIARWIHDTLGPNTPWHVTRFYPHLKLSHLSPTPVADLERAWAIGQEEGLRYVYLGNVPGHRLTHTYCHSCEELIIKRQVFDILQNSIRDGRCPKCGTVIPGKFS